jgi:hypothetical protein
MFARAHAGKHAFLGRFNSDDDKALEIIPAVIAKLRATAPATVAREATQFRQEPQTRLCNSLTAPEALWFSGFIDHSIDRKSMPILGAQSGKDDVFPEKPAERLLDTSAVERHSVSVDRENGGSSWTRMTRRGHRSRLRHDLLIPTSWKACPGREVIVSAKNPRGCGWIIGKSFGRKPRLSASKLRPTPRRVDDGPGFGLPKNDQTTDRKRRIHLRDSREITLAATGASICKATE